MSATYEVDVREVWVQTYSVQADSPEEAFELALAGHGEAIDGQLEYSYTPNSQGEVEIDVRKVCSGSD